MIRCAIIGAGGRMGRALVRAAVEFPEVSISAAVASTSSETVGKDIGLIAGVSPTGTVVTSSLPEALSRSDVAVDFSSPGATRANLAACRQAHKALLIGTTGFPVDLEADFAAAAKEIPLLIAPNTSLGITVLMELVRQAAAALPASFDIEILEAHHRMKKDAPSGTALALGRSAAAARGLPMDGIGSIRREGQSRLDGEIGFAVTRAGDLAGEHTVLFAGTGESLTLSHRATDRALFARGALQAALWLASRPPGRYFMRDLVAYKSGS